MRRVIVLALCAAVLLGGASAQAATISVPGDGPVLLAGDLVLHHDDHGRPVATRFPTGVSAPTGPYTTASATWIGEVTEAAIRVRRTDGTGQRVLLECQGASHAVIALHGSTAVYGATCPGDPGPRLWVADLDGGAAPRVLAAVSAWTVALSGTRVAVAGGDHRIEVLDLATGAVLQSTPVGDTRALAVLDDGTVAASLGGEADCDFRLWWIAPGGAVREGTQDMCGVASGGGQAVAYQQGRDIVVAEAPDRVQVVGQGREPSYLDGRVAWAWNGCLGPRVVATDVAPGSVSTPTPTADCPIRVGARAHLRRDGRIALTVSCPNGCRPRVSLLVDERRPYLRNVVRTPARRITVGPGPTIVTLAIPAELRRALRKAHRLRAQVDDGSGAAAWGDVLLLDRAGRG